MVEPDKQRTEWRLQCLEGHLAALVRMVEADEPTPALLQQISALQGGLEKVVQLLIQHHLEDCLSMAMATKTRREYERALQELVGVYQRETLVRETQADPIMENLG
ncbi:MAG: metal-sensitive transcriptional regulator [Anaerolineales bacterium]